MKKTLLLGIITFLVTQLIAQERLSGVVQNATNQDYLEFCHVINKSLNIGATSNAEGKFVIYANVNDTLIFTYVGFKKKEIVVKDFKPKTISLVPEQVKLNEFVLRTDKDNLLKLFKRAQRNLMHSKLQNSRTYFNLSTSEEGIPVEQMEAYYQTLRRPDSVLETTLKTGRVGLAKTTDERYFLSLRSVYVMGRYNLFESSHNKLPTNPMQISIKYINRNYRIEEVYQMGDIVQFSMIPNSNNHFHTTVWINEKSKRIVKYQLTNSNVTRHPFNPIFKEQSIDSLSLSLEYEFSDSKVQFMDRMKMDYLVAYQSNNQVNYYTTSAFLLYYNRQFPFHMPKQPSFLNKLNDYDKIIAQPHNAHFWKQTEAFIPSEQMLKNQRFFELNGNLLNYDDFQLPPVAFERHTLPWTLERKDVYDLNGSERLAYDSTLIKNYMIQLRDNKQVKLNGYLFFDVNQYPDTMVFTSQTVLNIKHSRFTLVEDRYHKAYVNTYFDLIEAERKDMEKMLLSQSWTLNQVDSIYDYRNSQLKKRLAEYEELTKLGINQFYFLKYCNFIHRKLGIDNLQYVMRLKLAEWETLNDPELKRQIANRQLINYYALGIMEGEYDEAIRNYEKFLARNKNELVPLNIGLCYFNMACAYSALEDYASACKYFVEANNLGIEVPEENMGLCRNNVLHRQKLFFEE